MLIAMWEKYHNTSHQLVLRRKRSHINKVCGGWKPFLAWDNKKWTMETYRVCKISPLSTLPKALVIGRLDSSHEPLRKSRLEILKNKKNHKKPQKCDGSVEDCYFGSKNGGKQNSYSKLTTAQTSDIWRKSFMTNHRKQVMFESKVPRQATGSSHIPW